MSDWLTYSPTSGYGNGTITITAQTMSELDGRVDALIASGINSKLSATASISQYGAPTSITFDSLSVVWINDVPWFGGVATKSNCSYAVYANYSDGTQLDVTNATEITGELEVPPTTAITRQEVGTLSLTASFYDTTATASVSAYQSPRVTGTSEYLTFVIISGGTIYWKKKDTSNPAKTISYSKDNGDTWVVISSSVGGKSIDVSAGDVILFKGNNSSYYGSTFSGSTAKFEVEGNIMSLVDSNGFATAATLSSESTFRGLFQYCSVTSAEHLVLPATTLTNDCYNSMFYYCPSLTKAPSILPADILANNCYLQMFQYCYSLTQAPELPAMNLASGCYENMFYYCSSLTTAPVLPATTLAVGCYNGMFLFCHSLTTAPELPAMNLANSCYCYMFEECTGLTQAPVLSATTLVDNCYFMMFSECKKLKSIKCLATDISASNCTNGWVRGVSSTGTFVKNSSMSNWTTGDSGIPSGWTVQNA